VRDIPDEIVKLLQMRTAELGGSAEEEHRRFLQELLEPTNGKVEKPNLFDDIRQLGEIAPDFEWLLDRNDPRNARPWRRDQGLFDD
jgi:plasmid stability protein